MNDRFDNKTLSLADRFASNFTKKINVLIQYRLKGNNSETPKQEAYLKELCNGFLCNIDGVLSNSSLDDKVNFLSFFRNGLKGNNSDTPNHEAVSHVVLNKITEVDQTIEKLILILPQIDMSEGIHIFYNVILCLKEILIFYHFFDNKECIELFNHYLIEKLGLNDIYINFPNQEQQEVLYYILDFLGYYYFYFYEQTSSMFDQYILPSIIESNQIFFKFLPSKHNKMYENNPILLIYKIFIAHKIKENSENSPLIQNIFDYLADYISQCQELIIAIDSITDDDVNDSNYLDMTSITNENCIIEDHISNCMHIYLIAFDTLGKYFFDIYNHQVFPKHFLFCLINSDSVKLKYASIDFIYLCTLKGIDISNYFDRSIYSSLVNLLRNHDHEVRIEVALTINNIININKDSVINFINENIEKSNVFPIAQSLISQHPQFRSCSNENYQEILIKVKLIQTIINFYPAGYLFKFDINYFVQYYLQILEQGNSDISSIIFKIFICMLDHLSKLGENKIDLFISSFMAHEGIDIAKEYVEGVMSDEASSVHATEFLSVLRQSMNDDENLDFQ